MAGGGREALKEAGSGRETLKEEREYLGGPGLRPGVVGRPSRMAGSGREAPELSGNSPG